jgi:2-polyprenyl-3-methyl-5-hydroxy-6-metoxy-1,4-benzoquinol methylase
MTLPSSAVPVLLADHPRLAFEEAGTLAREFLMRRLGALCPGRRFTFHDLDPAEIVAPDAPAVTAFAARHADRDQPTLVTSRLSPLLDHALVERMLDLARDKAAVVQVEGAVPGTAPLFVLPPGGGSGRPAHLVTWASQRRYGTQVDLFRLKRVKLFRSLLRRFSDLHTWSIERLLDFCGTPAGVELLLSYGEEMAFDRYEACPLCDNRAVYDLHSDGGHPVMGFFTRASVYYQRCGDCGLVFANPVARKQDLGRYYDGYETEAVFAAPVAERHAALSVANTSHLLNYRTLLDHHGGRLHAGARVVDLGGGQGEFCVYAKGRRPDLDVTLIDHGIAAALATSLERHGVATRAGDITGLDLGEGKLDLVTLWEVIEHFRVEDLVPLLRRIERALAPRGVLALSTPDFADPYCRALDFWAMAPGHHVTVLSRPVLEALLARAGLVVVAEHHESVTMKQADRWFAYGARCHGSQEARASAAIIDDLLRDEAVAEPHRAWMRQRGLGSELILVAQKAEAR